MYASFLENLTSTSRKKRRLTTMEVSTKAVETIPWESSRKKSRHSAIPGEKVSIHTLTTNVEQVVCAEIVESSVLASYLAHNIL